MHYLVLTRLGHESNMFVYENYVYVYIVYISIYIPVSVQYHRYLLYIYIIFRVIENYPTFFLRF